MSPRVASRSKRADKAKETLAALQRSLPKAKIELDFQTPLQLLVATILAAQSTDVTINRISPELFRKYPRPQDYLDVEVEVLQEELRPTGYFRQKAAALRGVMQALIERHEGEVPADLEKLVALPGVGRKTANVVLGNAFGIPGIPVDTHVSRVANRIGLVSQKDPAKIETGLMEIVPESDWIRFSLVVILHGRRVCKARRPLCDDCSLTHLCDYFREVSLSGEDGKASGRARKKRAKPRA